jgi:hypothetical protein
MTCSGEIVFLLLSSQTVLDCAEMSLIHSGCQRVRGMNWLKQVDGARVGARQESREDGGHP